MATTETEVVIHNLLMIVGPRGNENRVQIQGYHQDLRHRWITLVAGVVAWMAPGQIAQTVTESEIEILIESGLFHEAELAAVEGLQM